MSKPLSPEEETKLRERWAYFIDMIGVSGLMVSCSELSRVLATLDAAHTEATEQRKRAEVAEAQRDYAKTLIALDDAEKVAFDHPIGAPEYEPYAAAAQKHSEARNRLATLGVDP